MGEEEKGNEAIEVLDGMFRSSHGTLALVTTTQFEGMLEELICVRLPNLDTEMQKRFFERGALSSFYMKIEMAFATGAIDAGLRKDLHLLRDIRNKFAHPRKGLVHFDAPEMRALLQKFADYDAKMEGHDFFLKKVDDCRRALGPVM